MQRARRRLELHHVFKREWVLALGQEQEGGKTMKNSENARRMKTSAGKRVSVNQAANHSVTNPCSAPCLLPKQERKEM